MKLEKGNLYTIKNNHCFLIGFKLETLNEKSIKNLYLEEEDYIHLNLRSQACLFYLGKTTTKKKIFSIGELRDIRGDLFLYKNKMFFIPVDELAFTKLKEMTLNENITQ